MLPLRLRLGSDVINVQTNVHGLDQMKVQFLYRLHVAIDLFECVLDDPCLTATAARNQIAVGPTRRA